MGFDRPVMAYCRVSTLEQKRRGYGIDIQVRDVQAFAERQGLLVARFYRDTFDKGISGEVDTWDIQWVFANFAQGALTILPEANLVTNIGFGTDATHTRSSNARESNMPAVPMRFPLDHPRIIERYAEADEFTFQNSFGLDLSDRRVRAA